MIQPSGAQGRLSLLNEFPARNHAGLQFASPDEQTEVQTRLFLNHIAYTFAQSPFYREICRREGIDASDILDLSDLSRLPLTAKAHLEDTRKLVCAEPREIVDICLTSGTSGASATMIPLTSSDLARLACNEEIALGMAGITSGDTLLVCAALDRCFMAGMAYFLGGIRLSAAVVRGGAGSAAQHWELIRRTGATAIVGVPSLMHKIGEAARQEGGDPSSAGIRRLIAIGEPTRDNSLSLLPVSRELEAMWGAQIYSTYASSEMATTFCECEARAGGHVRPELIVVEILDDEGRPVPDGEIGEVVVTPLGVTGMPLIRFQTGDLARRIPEPCSCGRTTPRLSPVLGRKNQMLKYKGTTLFPNAVLAALEGDERFHGGYVEARRHPDGTDRVVFFAALRQESKDVETAPEWMTEKLRAAIRVVPEIRLISPEQADEKVYQFHKKRKRITFFDLR